MRILLISFQIPSASSSGSVRVRNVARFLLDRGHDVRVLSSPSPDGAVQSDWDESRLVLTPTREALDTEKSQTLRGKIAAIVNGGRRKTDLAAEWSQQATAAAATLFGEWTPDVIYGACPPNATALIAARVAKQFDIPFVAEVGDPRLTERSAKHSERRSPKDANRMAEVLKSAAALVTTSPAWAESYSNRFGSDKVNIAMNGFDPLEYPLNTPVPSDANRKMLRLLYTMPEGGAPQELATLFDGMAALGTGAADVRLTLTGNNAETVIEMARATRMERQIDFVPTGSRDEAVKRQFASDALVLTTRNDPADAGVLPAELFDYIAARRPVLAMGYSKGDAAEIIRKRDLGIFSNEPKVIANRLAHLLAKKRAVGVVPSLAEKVRDNAAIATQFAGLEPMLYGVVGSTPLSVAAE